MKWSSIPYYIIYSIMFVAYIIYYFTDIAIFGHIASWFVIISIILSWFIASKTFKVVSSGFIIVAITFVVISDQSFIDLYYYTLDNVPLIFFFSMMPWISMIFQIGGMKDSLTQTIQDKNNYMPNIYMKTFLNSGFLSVFLNISGTYIVQQIVMKLFSNEHIKTRNDIIVTATARAFSVIMMSAPLELIVVLSIDYTGVSYLTMLPWLFTVSFIGFLMEIVSSRKNFSDVKVDLPYTEINNRQLVKSLIKMLAILVVFVGIVILISQNTELSFIYTIGLTLFPFSFLVSIILRFSKKFLQDGFLSWKHHNNNLQNFVVLFLPLGIFSGSFSNSPFPAWMSSLFSEMEAVTVVLFIVAAAFITVMSLVGVHSVAAVAILFDVLLPVIDDAALLSFLVVVITSGVATTSYSPYSTVSNVTVQNIKISPYIILRRNKWFALRMMTIAIVVASIMLLI